MGLTKASKGRSMMEESEERKLEKKKTETVEKPQDESIPSLSIDALLPGQMAHKAEAIGVAKANMDSLSMLALAVLAGAFIALGAIFATVAWTTGGVQIPFGINRIIGGVVFSLGLILVVVGGAELFTGNALIIMAWASRKLSYLKVWRNWIIVYFGNLIGAIATAIFLFLSKQFMMGNGAVGITALNIGLAKVNLDFGQAIMLGILCNALVCLAVWLCYSARTTMDKILAIVFPISAFVAAGFEHSVANMFFVPIAIFIKQWAPAAFWQVTGANPATYQSLTWGSFIIHNLIPVTIGNVIGGAALVGGVYWIIYQRKKGPSR
jgi:formate transporter